MSTAKKIQTDFDDQVNAKIQKKFDLVFTDKPSAQPVQKNENFSTILNDDIQFDTGSDDGFVMERNGNDGGDAKKEAASQINLDFSLDDDAPKAKNETVEKPSDDGLDFSLDFDMDAPIETTAAAAAAPSSSQSESEGFTLDDADIGPAEMEFDEATKKTVMISKESLTKSNLEEFSLETTGSHSSADLMSSEEAKANIESTIKDILRPKLDGTKELKVGEMTAQTNAGLEDIEDSELSFRDNTPSKGFVLEEMGDDAFTLDSTPKPKAAQAAPAAATSSGDATGEFDIGGLDDVDFSLEPAVPTPVAEPIEEFTFETPAAVSTPAPSARVAEEKRPQPTSEAPVSMGVSTSSLSSMPTEDSMRFQATIRALREEREELLAQIKTMKADSKELEQDNLTLKANLDEAKIEISILRKRHMVEVEDLKYRLTMSDEKKAMADEKARHADMLRAKLEQKVRIDYNQVKQREKELESKLELLSMDVDSQVQSRDQKILELRRKIDALEFNMENASIKEQKSLDDKRKLEDRLNKIMKTLRHSIKNLEEDIDEAQGDDDNQKEKI